MPWNDLNADTSRGSSSWRRYGSPVLGDKTKTKAKVARELGIRVNQLRQWRLDFEEEQRNGVPKRRHRSASQRLPPRATQVINECWAMDFVSDQLYDGRKLRALTLVDVHTRECLAIWLDQGIRGDDVVRTLGAVIASRGQPERIQVDNGREFISKVMDKWAYERGVELDFSRPGKPTDNARVEAFNGRLRQECLNANWFLSLDDATEKIGAWRTYYNESRPHSALDWATPAEFARRCGLPGTTTTRSRKSLLLSGTETGTGSRRCAPSIQCRWELSKVRFRRRRRA